MKAILQRKGRRRTGQTMIFLLMICVILALVVLWNFDLHKIITVKLRAQDGGDAAALAAARWQGITLNLVGHLNVLQAVAISDGLARGQTDFPEAQAIADLAARLCYVGPVTALAAAQLGAKNNGVYNNSAYAQLVASHGAYVTSQYPDQFPVQPYTNAPSPPTAWDDYGTMLAAVAGQGIAALPDNTRFYVDYSGDHLLLNPSFYDAVGSSDWCWFFHHAYSTLQNYTGYQDWPPLPIIRDPEPMNSEFFGLGLMRLAYLDSLPMIARGTDAGDVDAVIALMEQIAGSPITSGVSRVSAQWYCYSPDRWSAWTGLIPDGFPFRGTVRPEYDYIGADAAVRIETETDRVTPGAGRRWVTWSAAAKPFGFLEGPERPNRYGLVLPAFHDVRLIPVDTATGIGGGSRPGWATHIHDHLPTYVSQGLPGTTPGCWYCEQLHTWENASFRQTGIEWLASYSARCHQPGGGGGGSSGGTRRGH
jgi:hypothetical protein